jgi:hypothetical protein
MGSRPNENTQSSATSAVTMEALAVALDCVSTPTFLLRPDAQIVHVNVAGNALLRGSPALYRARSRLAARRAQEARTLATVVARVAESQRPELLRLLGRNGTVSLLMSVTPVPGDTLVTACVADLRAEGPSLAGWIEEAFSFSPQNAELAEHLMLGSSLSEFSNETGVTLGAARTRLKKLFAGTGTRSQAALVSALLRAAIIAPHRQR